MTTTFQWNLCVVDAIEQFFDMDRESAMHLMLRVHNEGIAECGTYSYEIAKARRRRWSPLPANIGIRFNALSSASGKDWPSEGCFCALLRSGGRHRVCLIVGVDRK